MKNNQTTLPIGIFDSGLGGLSILSEVKKRLPNEQLIYLADSNNAPYGEKPKKNIIDISKHNTDFLLSKSCKLIVVACNTATTNAIGILRKTYNLPFIGIEPALKPAALQTKNGKVGVLATKGTLSSALFAETAKKYSAYTQVIEVVGKGIVEAIENHSTDTDQFDQLLNQQLLTFKKARIDTLVLGCSHYPFIIRQIQKHLGLGVNIIDSGFAVAKQTERVLKFNGMENHGDQHHKNIVKIYTNGTSKVALKNILNQLSIKDYQRYNFSKTEGS